MPHKLKYDWDEIQTYYDQGNSIRQCQDKYGFGNTARIKSVKAGRFVQRTHEEACKLLRTKDYDRESKSRFSETSLAGEVACAKLDCRALEKKVIVSKPNLECSYDRVVDQDGRLWRVQVKYSSQDDGNKVCSHIRKTSRKRDQKVSYNEDEIDAIVIYSSIADELYWLPKNVWAGKLSVTLRHKPSKSGQKKNIQWAENYVW